MQNPKPKAFYNSLKSVLEFVSKCLLEAFTKVF